MYAIIDTETAGFGKDHPVLQIGYARFDSAMNPIDEYSAYLKHEFDYEIDEGAFKIHGLTKEFLAENGKNPVIELTRIAEVIDSSDMVVFHNRSFDWRMLTQDWARYGLFQDQPGIKTKTFCTQNDSQIRAFVGALDKNGRVKAPSLAELHFHLFDVGFEGAHDALADVRATAKCFFELRKRGLI